MQLQAEFYNFVGNLPKQIDQTDLPNEAKCP